MNIEHKGHVINLANFGGWTWIKIGGDVAHLLVLDKNLSAVTFKDFDPDVEFPIHQRRIEIVNKRLREGGSILCSDYNM